MLSDLAGFVDVGVGEALGAAAEDVGASPAAQDVQQAVPHVSLRGGRPCVAVGGKRRDAFTKSQKGGTLTHSTQPLI